MLSQRCWNISQLVIKKYFSRLDILGICSSRILSRCWMPRKCRPLQTGLCQLFLTACYFCICSRKRQKPLSFPTMEKRHAFLKKGQGRLPFQRIFVDRIKGHGAVALRPISKCKWKHFGPSANWFSARYMSHFMVNIKTATFVYLWCSRTFAL